MAEDLLGSPVIRLSTTIPVRKVQPGSFYSQEKRLFAVQTFLDILAFLKQNSIHTSAVHVNLMPIADQT